MGAVTVGYKCRWGWQLRSGRERLGHRGGPWRGGGGCYFPPFQCIPRYGPGTDHTDHVLLEPRDTRAESGAPLSAKDLQWPVGARVVISARSPGGYLTADDPTGTGMLPLWLDWTSKADRDANQRANDTILKGLKAGVEVATIKAVDTDGDAIKVSFARPLKLLHDSSRHKMTRTLVDGSQSSCYVDTQLHVALLSRKISISSDFSSAPGDGGCNVRPWDKPPTGQCCGCPGEQTIVPNYEAGAGNNVYAACYKTLYEQTKTGPPKVDDELLNYWGDGAAPPRPKGHWLYGTTGLQGPNSILGGHTMFRYGSGAVLDGVELWRLGQPGNFGSIGRYPLHCHLSGAAQSFSAYLPEGAAGKFGRGMEILNGSCWLSFNRWYTVHGSQEVNTCAALFGAGWCFLPCRFGTVFCRAVLPCVMRCTGMLCCCMREYHTWCARGACFRVLPQTYPPSLRLVFGGMHLLHPFLGF